MIIRKAKLGDEIGISRVHVDTWMSTYKGLVSDHYLNQLDYQTRTKKWHDLLMNNDHTILVAEIQNQIIAYIYGGNNRDFESNYDAELYAIYILKEFQRQDIGTELIKSFVKELLENHMNSMVVWVLKGNPANHFYEKCGGKKGPFKTISLDGKPYDIISYCWDDIRSITN